MKGYVKAPSKLILTGEHSVVYDKPALLMAIGMYTTIEYSYSPGDFPARVVIKDKEDKV